MINITGGKLHKGQKELVKHIIIDDKMFNILVMKRQWGKTYLLIQLILYFSQNPSRSLIIAPSYKQVNRIKNELIRGVEKSKCIKKINNVENTIELINGSILIFGSSESFDKLRGESINYMYIDEAAFMKEEVFNTVLRPMLLVAGKKCIMASTPKGKNYFYNLSLMETKDPKWKTYRSQYNNPLINLEEIESARLSLPEMIFRQEYMAEFIGDGGSVFPNLVEICSINKFKDFNPNQRYFAGLDLGNEQDFTVLSIFDQNGECVHIYRKNRQDWENMINEMRNILNLYKPICYVETNGPGNPVFNFLSKGCSAKLVPIFHHQSNKQNNIENLILSCNEKRILLPSKDLFDSVFSEMSTFSFEYNKKSRTIKYCAIEGFHDDTVMSIALANQSLMENKNKGKLRIL